MKFKNVIAFAILMENDQGILSKSSEYVKEKFNRTIVEEHEDPKLMLDAENRIKFNNWFVKWDASEDDKL